MLLAVFAGRLGYARPDGIFACARELLRGGQQKDLGDVLVARKVLSSQQREVLDGMVRRALDVGGDDPRRTVELLPKEQQQLVQAMFAAAPAGAENLGVSHPTVEVRAQLFEADDAVSQEQPGRYKPALDKDGKPIELGKGGGGKVVLVHDTVMGREVAFKAIDPDATPLPQDTVTSTAAVARFLREARLAGQLEHPAVVPVYELGHRADGQHYYTMMRVNGRTLAVAIAEARSLEERLKLVPAFLTVAQCIAYAHSRGVVHRDMKPQNVMLGAFGEVYVIDWGLARKRDQADPRAKDLALAPDISAALEVQIVGTPSYMSPEQAWGKVEEIDERSDVWGLGAVLYELLTGRAPYVGATAVEVLAQVRSVEPEAVETLAKNAPRELLAICRKALAREPRQRYANAEELSRDVNAFLSGRRVHAHTYSSAELVRRYVSRHRVQVATTLALVGAMAVATTLGLSRVKKERDDARAFAELFIDDVADKLTPVPGVMGLVEKLSQAALKHFERTVDVAKAPHEQRLRVARALVRLGNLQQELGRNDDAGHSLELGLKLARSVLDEAPGDARAMVVLSSGLRGRAMLQRIRGELPAWRKDLEEALPWAEKAVARLPADSDALGAAVQAYSDLGQLSLQSSDVEAARRAYERAVDLDRRALKLETQKDRAALALSEDYASLAMVADAEKKSVEAKDLTDKALEAARQAVALNPKSRTNTINLTKRLTSEVDLIRRTEPSADPSALLGEAEALMNRLLAEQPDDTLAADLMIDVQAQLEHWEQAWVQLKANEARGNLADVGSVAPAIAFLARHDEEAIRLAQQPLFEGDGTALVYRAMAAAMLGRAGEAAIAARAARGKLGALQWLPGTVLKQTAGGTPLSDAVRTFAKALDEATYARNDDQATQALEAFIGAVEKRITVDVAPK